MWYRKVTLYMTVISGYIWHLAVPWLNCIIFMLPETSLNYEHFDFPTSFPKKFTMPTSIRSELFDPFHKCAFLVRLNVSRLDVRFSNATSFPSRKQVEIQGMSHCPAEGQHLWAAALCRQANSWAGAGSKDRGWALWGVQVREQLSPRKALSLERVRSLSFPPPQWCLILWASGVPVCTLLGTQAVMAQVALQGLVNIKKIKRLKWRYWDTPVASWDWTEIITPKTHIVDLIRCFVTAVPRQWRSSQSKLTILSRSQTIHKELEMSHTSLSLEATWLHLPGSHARINAPFQGSWLAFGVCVSLP